MESDEDIKKAIAKSKIKYDSKGDLIDVRYQKDIKAYAEWQAGNRQLNAENKEFEQMQAYYKSKGETPPYTTLAGFKRARRSDNLSPAYKKWRNRNQDTTTLERWEKVNNFKNFPKTLDKLQDIKYNKPKQWERLKRERKTIEDLNSKNWSETFYKKAVDTYYYFRDKGVEFTDHGLVRYMARMDENLFWEIHNKPFDYV